MKPSELFEALHALITEHVPLHIWGACGVGKSQIVAQVASDLGWQFLDIRAVQLDPVDLRGLPRISADQAEWVPPKFLPTSGKGILFLDELTAAPQMTQAGCYQLVLDRKLGEYHLPEGWVVVAAGNPASERGVHFSMPRPLRNRFVHLSLEPDFEDWCHWAVRSGLRPEIVAFLRFKPALLHDANATSDVNAWPTPRSWEMASNVLTGFARRQKSGFFTGATEIEAQLLEGTVGPAATTELVAFLRLFRDLPSIDEILLNPDSGAASQRAFCSNRDCDCIREGPQRSFHREGHAISRSHANRDARTSDTRRSRAESWHHPYTGVRSLRCRTCGGSPMITERAMLAAVHISIWTAVKHDRKVSRDVANQHGAHESAGRYNKQLLRGAEKLDALRTLAGQIRQHFYKITLPWSDEGYRLLPAHFYFELTTQMREFERAFSQSVEEFLEVYPSYIEQVRPELNGLFREEDYPSAEKLRAKFGVKLEVLPIPSGDDFRVTSQRKSKRGWREKSTRVYVSRSIGGPRTCGCG